MNKIEPFPGEVKRSNAWGWPYVLTTEQKAWLKRNFPCHSVEDLIAASGMSHGLLYKMKKKLNLRKSQDYIDEASCQRAEKFKKTIRDERRRQLWGEKRQTNLHLPTRPYTRSETSRRYRALQMGYLLDYDRSDKGGNRYVIFYDRNTKRNEVFESNSIRAGFIIKEWEG